MPFYLQNTIKIGKIGQIFINLEEILKFLPRKKKFRDTKNTHQVGSKSDDQEMIFFNHVSHPACSDKRIGKLQFWGQE